MPNLISHVVFAEEVYKNIQRKEISEIIRKYKEEYWIGANGPDFLFFYDLFPLWKKQDKEIPSIGGGIHSKNINLFYQTCVEEYRKQKEGPLKEAMLAYICGHFLHWQLDSIMHPYVVYHCGFNEKLSRNYHHRFESMMDTILLKKYWNKTTKTFKTYTICTQSKYTIDVIYSIYSSSVKNCLNKEISKDIIAKSLQDWMQAQRYLYDPYNIKYPIVLFLEKCIKNPWLLSGSIVLNKIDTKHDIANENHHTWHHPCTNEAYNDSLYDLMEQAIYFANIGLELLWDAIESKDCTKLLKHIDDKSYGNGIKENVPRMYKKVIYK